MFDTKTQDNQCDQLNNAEVRLVENHWTEMGNKLTAPELSPHPHPYHPTQRRKEKAQLEKPRVRVGLYTIECRNSPETFFSLETEQ